MEQIGILETVCRYPVKSMAGEELDRAFVGFAGLMGDRVHAFVRKPGPKGFPWHTARQQEDLVLFRPRFRSAEAATMPLDVLTSFGMGPGVSPVFPDEEAFAVDVTTPEGRTLPLGSPELEAELQSRAGSALTLRLNGRNLYDCRPISLLGNASAAGLGRELGMEMDRRRFRANFYADWSQDRPYRENELVGRTLQIGPRLRIALLELDSRCKMITIDPDTAEADQSVLRHVKTAHQGMIGVYAAVLVQGIVHKGDPIFLV